MVVIDKHFSLADKAALQKSAELGGGVENVPLIVYANDITTLCVAVQLSAFADTLCRPNKVIHIRLRKVKRTGICIFYEVMLIHGFSLVRKPPPGGGGYFFCATRQA